jgi:hypothetical protein
MAQYKYGIGYSFKFCPPIGSDHLDRGSIGTIVGRKQAIVDRQSREQIYQIQWDDGDLADYTLRDINIYRNDGWFLENGYTIKQAA